MKRVLLTTFDSYGDLDPYIAVGVALRALGAEPCIVATEIYQEDVLAGGKPLR